MNVKTPFVDEYSGVPRAPQCNLCKHFEGFGLCPAFPDGIPIEIIDNELIHNEVLEGQEEPIIWEPKEN